METPQLLYIGYFVETKTFNEIVRNKVNDMSAASRRLEEALLREFGRSSDVSVRALSYVPNSDAVDVPEASYVDNLRVDHIRIRKGSLWSSLRAMIVFGIYLLTEVPKGSAVVMYAVNPVFVFPLWITKKLKRLELTTICSEVPAYRRYKPTLAMRLKRAMQTFFNNRFDKYILLAEPMKEVVAIGSKPYIVMEGIASELPDKVDECERKNVVMYAGGLHPDNNLMLLIEACKKSELVEECWICGSGPQEDEIRRRVAGSKKVKMLGRLSQEEVLERERQAKILVNLRDNRNPLTRYSFPSKVLEYLSSGAHVVSSRLAGIPDEYFEYLHEIPGYDANLLSQTFDSIIALSNEEFYSHSKKALEFLKNKKSASVQARKILDFVCRH